LRKEKDNISKNYQELKLKMTKFRDEEEKRRKELSNNSRNAVEKLKEYEALGEKILKTAELCRRHETEKEKVLPFFEGSVE
jgi:putative methionine-R-sulfoxide reductase with GAF domain